MWTDRSTAAPTSMMPGGVELIAAALSANSGEGETDEGSMPAENDHWLVGGYWHSSDPPDQSERFLDEGIWQNGHKDKSVEEVRSIKVGDRITIRSSSTQKKNLPFDARGNTVPKISITAIGIVVASLTIDITIASQFVTAVFQQPDESVIC